MVSQLVNDIVNKKLYSLKESFNTRISAFLAEGLYEKTVELANNFKKTPTKREMFESFLTHIVQTEFADELGESFDLRKNARISSFFGGKFVSNSKEGKINRKNAVNVARYFNKSSYGTPSMSADEQKRKATKKDVQDGLAYTSINPKSAHKSLNRYLNKKKNVSEDFSLRGDILGSRFLVNTKNKSRERRKHDVTFSRILRHDKSPKDSAQDKREATMSQVRSVTGDLTGRADKKASEKSLKRHLNKSVKNHNRSVLKKYYHKGLKALKNIGK